MYLNNLWGCQNIDVCILWGFDLSWCLLDLRLRWIYVSVNWAQPLQNLNLKIYVNRCVSQQHKQVISQQISNSHLPYFSFPSTQPLPFLILNMQSSDYNWFLLSNTRIFVYNFNHIVTMWWLYLIITWLYPRQNKGLIRVL